MKSKKAKDKKESGNKAKTAPTNNPEQEKNVDATMKDAAESIVDNQDDAGKEAIISSGPYQELNDKYLRLYSEFDNYRKRTLKEKLEMSKTAAEEVITELLPVLDDFERAAKSSNDDQNCKAIKEGIDLILNKFRGILEKKGLKPIIAIGEEFNTDYHEAITYIPAPSDDLKGKIVDEIEKGYMLNDKVIRYTKVVIGQ